MNEALGQIHFWGTMVIFNLIFIPLFYSGMAGQHRRVANYNAFPDLAGLDWTREIATYALLAMLLFQVAFIVNFVVSYRKGKPADGNPWNSTTLEWACPSPPPHGNFAQEITVYRGPYEYGVPGAKQDYLPQNLRDA